MHTHKRIHQTPKISDQTPFTIAVPVIVVVMQAINKPQGKLADLLDEPTQFGAARTSQSMADVLSNADK